MNDRRRLLGAIGAGAVALSAARGAAGEPQGKVWRVGFLAVRPEPNLQGAFARGMWDLGFVEGRNLVIESRAADGQVDRLPALADDLLRLNVDVIVTAGTVATGAAQRATRTVPIVMGSSADPVGIGLVRSLAHPGGNVTGLSTLRTDTSPKLLELLHGAVPRLARVAVLTNPTNTSHAIMVTSVRAAAQSMGIAIVPVAARTLAEIERTFADLVQDRAGAVIVARDGAFLEQRRPLAQLAMKSRLPSISEYREYVDAGMLMSYGPSLADQFRRAAGYVVKILRGAKPDDLPVEQASQFEFVVNLATARTIGLAIPPSLLLRADEVIE